MALAALGLDVLLADDLFGGRLLRIGISNGVYAVVAALVVLACVVPLLRSTSRRRVVKVGLGSGAIALADATVRGVDVAAFDVVRGERGLSVGLMVGKDVRFLEVEREADVARIALALGTGPKRGELALKTQRVGLAVAQLLTAMAGTAAAAFYLHAALLHAGEKGPAGLVGIACSHGALLVMFLRAAWRGPVGSRSAGAYDNHVALHARGPNLEGFESASGEVTTLSQGAEPVAAWLARLDAPAGGSAYREDVPPRDQLWSTMKDDAAPLDARMAAARLLRLRFAEAPETLTRVVSDPEERVRIEAAMEEAGEAEARLAALGPLVRLRAR